jgi:hypothetical protein
MKKLALALTLTVIASSVALAADPVKGTDSKETKKAQAQPAKELPTQVDLTGSYIRRTVRRNGKITDGPSQVVVLDREMIDRSGAGDLKQVLIRQGIH